MRVQILNSFHGDDIKEFDGSPEGRGSASKLIADLLRTGSALFLEREVNGKTYTFRVSGYDADRDKIRLVLASGDEAPEDVEYIQPTHKKGKPPKRSYRARMGEAMVDGSRGLVVSVAPVAGGSVGVEDEPEGPSWEAVRWGVAKLCEERGWHHGCPMPSSTDEYNGLIVAPGSPLHDRSVGGKVSFGSRPGVHVCSVEDVDEDAPRLVNKWEPTQVRVEVYRDSKGLMPLRIPVAYEKLRVLLTTMLVRAGAVDWETELTAMMSLQMKISDRQWTSYVLNGAFPETSQRSGVTYILRKGLPTLALRLEKLPDGREMRHFLAALCLHPMAYYEHTWAGSQPPSDEVIAHLMMIRANEHFYWRKAGQHPIESPLAAI